MTVKDVFSSSSSRDHPILFGTSAACDVILDGDGIRPVHGRIRWKKTRFRVEASPDAEFVQLNGSKMAAGSLNEGDEITIGSCRIFLLRNDDTIDVRQSMSCLRPRTDTGSGCAFVPLAPKNDLGHRPVQPKRDTGHQPITPQSEKGHQPRTVLPRMKAPEAPVVAKDDGPENRKRRRSKGAGDAQSNDFVGPDVAIRRTDNRLGPFDRAPEASHRWLSGTGAGTDP